MHGRAHPPLRSACRCGLAPRGFRPAAGGEPPHVTITTLSGSFFKAFTTEDTGDTEVTEALFKTLLLLELTTMHSGSLSVPGKPSVTSVSSVSSVVKAFL